MALPPRPRLRTGRESSPSSGSSRYEVPPERSRFSRQFNPSLMAVDYMTECGFSGFGSDAST